MSLPPTPELIEPSQATRLPRVSLMLRVGGALALLILMFATSWYGLSSPAQGSFGAAGSTAASAWTMLRIVRWLLLVAVAAGALSLFVPGRGPADLALLLGLLATGALFYRLLIALPDPHAVLDVKVGGYLALVACATLTLGAYEAEPGAGPRAEPGAGPGARSAARAAPRPPTID